MKPKTEIDSFAPRITAAEAALVVEDKALAEISRAHSVAAEATRTAALAYAADRTPERLDAHRVAKDAQRAKDTEQKTAQRQRDAAAAHLEQVIAERSRLENEAARIAREAKASAEASAEAARRADETAADRAELEQLGARLGRVPYMQAIQSAIDQLLAARVEMERALWGMSEAAAEQEKIAAQAVEIATEIGAPPPPATVGEGARSIALVLARAALRKQYDGRETPVDLGPWIDDPALVEQSGARRPAEAFERWAFHILAGREYQTREHVTAAESVEALLVHGSDVMAAVEGERRQGAELAPIAARTTGTIDPILRARAAVFELGFAVARDQWISPDRPGVLRAWISEGIAAIEALPPAKIHKGRYTTPEGSIELNTGRTPAYSLGLRAHSGYAPQARAWLAANPDPNAAPRARGADEEAA
jgi:chemotaxis protein histidine kinase CheA